MRETIPPLPLNAGLDAFRDLSDAQKLVAYDRLLERHEKHLEESRWYFNAWLRWQGIANENFRKIEDLRLDLITTKRELALSCAWAAAASLSLAYVLVRAA